MGKVHTPSENVKVQAALDPEVRTAAANGAWVDTYGFDRALVILHVGAHDRTTGDETLDVKVQESADAGVADAGADIAGAAFAQLGNIVPDAAKGIVRVMDINLNKRERYIRPVGTPGGTTPSTAYGVTVILFNGTNLPVAQDAAAVSV